jgi:hypothetical protein
MQTTLSFDKESIKKIAKGAAIATTGAAALAFLDYIGQIQINEPVLAMLVAFAVPTLVNLVKEFIKGE